MSAEQAAYLADQVAGSIHEARRSLIQGADRAEELGAIVRQVESSVDELNLSGTHAGRADQPTRFLLDAQGYATEAHRKLGQGEELINEVRGQLDQTRDHLANGRRSLDELTRLPEQQGELTSSLRGRLDTLDTAVRDVSRQMEQVSRKLSVAQGNVEPMVEQARSGNLQGLTSAAVANTARAAEQNVQQAKEQLNGLREGFDKVGPEANAAQRDAVELERVARAGFNPPVGQRAAAAGSAESTFRIRPSGSDRHTTPER
jgi:chromosome segregation ATPase